MKKTFVNPEMNISLFEMENVLTESNYSEAVDNNAAKGVTDVTQVNASEITWTF